MFLDETITCLHSWRATASTLRWLYICLLAHCEDPLFGACCQHFISSTSQQSAPGHLISTSISPLQSPVSNLLIERRLQILRDILSPTHIKYILWHVYVGILPQLDEMKGLVLVLISRLNVMSFIFFRTVAL